MNYARRLDRRAASRKARRLAVKDQIRRGLMAERLEDRSLMAGDVISSFMASSPSAYWNPAKPGDVNADGTVAPNDALAIINAINAQGSHKLPTVAGEGETNKLYLDVTNDGYLAPNDALAVINQLNGEGQGPPKIQYTFKAVPTGTTDALAATGLTSVQAGQTYDLVLIGQDLRPNGTFTLPDPDNPGQFLTKPLLRGVYAGYTDLLYDKSFSAVNLAEIQTLAFSGGTTGSFTLTLGSQTTGTINFDNTSQATRATTATNIQTALNTLLGTANNPTPIIVTNTPATSNNYRVRFAGFPTVDEPTLTAGNVTAGTTINATETLTGNPNNSAAFLSQVVFNNNIQIQTGTDPNTGDPIFSTFGYVNGQFAANAADRIDDLGAFTNAAGSGLTTDPHEILRVHMMALLPGTQTSGQEVFTPSLGTTDPILNPAPNGLIRPDHSPLVFGNNAATPPEISDVADDEIVRNTLTLAITSGPINASPIAASTNEDTSVTINILDPANVSKNPGAPAGALQVISVSTVSPTGAGTLQTQTLPSTNGNVTFSPGSNFNGTATFTYTVGIQGDTNVSDQRTQTVTVTVNPVNDAPTINVPGAQSTTEDTAKSISGITVADVDADASGGVQLTLNVGHGSLHATGSGAAVLSGNDTGTLTITGLVTDVNASVATLSYTPSLDFSGSDSLTATVNDQGNTGSGGPLSASKSVAISIGAVNDPPAISAPSAQAVVFVQTLTFSSANNNAITINDPDAGTDPIKVTLTVAGGVGTLHVTPSGGATITGGANDSTTLTLTGPQAGINATLNGMVLTPPQSVQTGSITIDSDDQGHNPAPAKTDHKVISIQTAPPVLPFAVNDTASFAEGTTGGQTINVLSNDLLNTGATATITAVTQPSSGLGSVAISGNTLVYTLPSDPDFFTPVNPVTFTYTMNDNGTGSQPSTATVSVTITNVADTPVATNDSYGTAIGVALTRNASQGVLANDTDIDNNYGKPDVATLTVLTGSVTQPAHGTVTVAADGSFTYTPNSGFGGDDTFTYRAHSSLGPDSAPATVSIHVAAPPQAVNDAYTTAQEDQAFTSPTSVLANDSDPTEHQPLTATLVTNVPAAAGSVTLNADGTFTYNPAPNFNTTRPAAPDISFTYKASAGGRDSNVATVTIRVNEVNDNPTANDDTFLAVKNNGTIGIDQPVPVLGNDSILPDVSINGDETLTVVSVGPTAMAANGSSVKVVNGQILYTSPTITGNDSFTYTISDGRGGTATATVNVTVVDFVPKTVSGTIYLDANNDGNVDSGEKRLSGVAVTLTGTDFTNQAVALTATTDQSGNYSFVGLKPPKVGTSYTLTEVQPVYLLSGLDTNGATGASATLVTDTNRLDDLFALSWAVTDQSGNIGNLNFGERGIDVASLSNSSGLIQEFFASSGSNGFVLAVDSSGNIMWNWTLPGWDNAKSISATLSPSLTSLTLSVIDGQNHTFSITLTQGYSIPGSTARFRILGIGQNGQYIIRIDGSANGATDGMGMNLLAATSGAGGEGEASGGQYINSADAVFTSEAWA